MLQKQNYDGHTAYSQSKLANLMYTVVLAPKMQPKGVTVNCVHPGVVSTKVLNSGWGGGGISVEVNIDVKASCKDSHCYVQDCWKVCLYCNMQPSV